MNRADNPFGPLANPLVAAALLTLWISLLLVFRGEPQWDLDTAGHFFDAARCAATERAGRGCSGFELGSSRYLSAVRDFLHPVPVILGIAVLVLLVIELATGHRWSDARVRLETVLFTTLVIGPGLIVNVMLKPNWGRPRPWMTDVFGGWLSFVEAGRNTDLCASNCSFVSGEAAGAGWLMCVALLFAFRRKPFAAIAVAVVAIVMAGLRVAFGAHYLSDAVLGFFMTVVVFSVLAAFAQWTVPTRR